MMKKTLMMMAGLIVGMTMSAATVTKDEARQKALQFLSERGSAVAAARSVQPVSVQLSDGLVSDELYAFNIGRQDGFVIVSGDDCTGDMVLAYSDQGELRADNMPDNLRAWLQGYADQIQWMRRHGVSSTAGSRAMKVVKKTVPQLLSTKWNQGAPYNNNCPWLDNTGSQIAATGCVATATAQLMYYQARKHGLTSTTTSKAIPSYESNKYHLYINGSQTTTVPSKAVRTFDWTKLTDVPVSSAEASEEVARLIEYIGAGVQMQYGPSSSSANEDVPVMLTTYFGYDSDAKSVYRNNYIYEDWLNLIYDELSANGPVLFGGQSVGGGHAFLLDGYDGEDFFHVNWGWGGLSDGYYRLSVLNPTEQGTGGSTTTDGYNFDQVVMTGVNPVDDGVSQTSDARLTVGQWESNRTTMTKHSDGNFYYISGYTLYPMQLSFYLSNNSGISDYFEWGAALYKDGDFVQLVYGPRNQPMVTTAYTSGTTGTFAFGDGLADGEYELVAVSRRYGVDTWYKCTNSERYHVKVTISGNNMTLQNIADTQAPSLSATLSLSGTAEIGKPATIIARISNSGGLYTGNMNLIWNDGGNCYQLSGRQIDVEGGASGKEYEFSFTPSQVGTWNLELWNRNNETIGSTSIEVGSSTATTSTLAVTSLVLKNGNLSQGKVYGTTAQATLTVRNTGSVTHNSGIRVGLMKWINMGGGSYSGSSVSLRTYPLTLAAGATTTVDVELDGMEVGSNQYGFAYYYTTGGSNFSSSSFFSAVAGVDIYMADGTKTTVERQSTIAAPADALALDVTGVTTVTPNSNPNTLYIANGSAPSGLTGKNVVVNGVASTLTLDDNYAFFSPVNFTAATATYTRTFTQGADGTNGWTTLIVPFDVTAVKQGSTAIDWFHSGSDTGKQFWLKQFSGESGATVAFDHADRLQANTPYIIAVPGSKWGSAYDLTGKAITFEGSGVSVTPTSAVSASGNSYKFTGASVSQSVADSYVLNASGNRFERTSTTLAPFRAYFKALTQSAAQPQWLTISSGETTAISATLSDKEQAADGTVYNLKGQRVSQPKSGLYIVNGKKVVVK